MSAAREPEPTRWHLPDPHMAESGQELLGVGADLRPGTLLSAYRCGLFPMPVKRRGPVGWWSPDPRAIVPLSGLVVSRSLRVSSRKFVMTVDTAFADVLDACADPRRPQGWITRPMREAYLELHRQGWAHSVETRTPAGELVGGLYGVEIGGLFAGESMFHLARDASKVALVHLVARLSGAGTPAARVLDVQWLTAHLASLGAVAVPRARYLALLPHALELPPAFDPPDPAN